MGPPPSSSMPWSIQGPRACIHKRGRRGHRVGGPERTLYWRRETVNKLSKSSPASAGVDVSQATLDVGARDHDGNDRTAQFDNTATGHRQLIRWLTKGGKAARVVLEATGVYSLDLALALGAAKRVEVM